MVRKHNISKPTMQIANHQSVALNVLHAAIDLSATVWTKAIATAAKTLEQFLLEVVRSI